MRKDILEGCRYAAYKQGRKDALDDVVKKLKELEDMPGCVGSYASERHVSIPWLIRHLQKMEEE